MLSFLTLTINLWFIYCPFLIAFTFYFCQYSSCSRYYFLNSHWALKYLQNLDNTVSSCFYIEVWFCKGKCIQNINRKIVKFYLTRLWKNPFPFLSSCTLAISCLFWTFIWITVSTFTIYTSSRRYGLKNKCTSYKYLRSFFWGGGATGRMSSVFANGPRDQSRNPGRIIPKTQKMVIDSTLLITQQYYVGIKGKMEQSREQSIALPVITLV